MPSTDDTAAERPEATSADIPDAATSADARRSDIREYLNAVFGETKGVAFFSAGIAGYINAHGRYQFDTDPEDHPKARWLERTCVWPDKAGVMAQALAKGSDNDDIYICPYLMISRRKRTPANAVPASLDKVHSDIDRDDWPPDKLTDLGGWAASTGTPGHAHVYVDLARPVPLHQHTALCRALGAHLGGADSKIKPNDVLRPPGTWNHKQRARGGESSPVEWLIRPTGVRWEPAELAAKFGITLPDAPPDGTKAKTANGKARGKTAKAKGATTTRPRPDDADDDPAPFDLGAYPDVKAALDCVTGDRSRDTNRIVAAVYDAGLTLPNARWACEERDDLAGRLDGRRDDDVLTLWLKTEADRVRLRVATEDADDGDDADDDAGDGDGGKLKGDAKYTDAALAEVVADKVLQGRFVYIRGIGWLQWTGTVWADCGDGPPTEAVRSLVMRRLRWLHAKLAKNPNHPGYNGGVVRWTEVASRYRITAILKLATNLVEGDAAQLDADPDLLNTPSGIVDLRTGELLAHDPSYAMTKITKGSYRLNDDGTPYRHPDVEKALTALDLPERTLLLSRIGQAITGHQTPDDVIPLLQGEGGNGKTGLVGHGMVTAFGGYAHIASAKLFAATEKGSEHSTEMADLRGRRFVLGEEMQEGARLNITVLKRITVAKITARYCHQDNITFDCTHSLFLTSNPVPIVVETDDGTWRRMMRLCFPYRYVATEADVERPTDQIGDPGLRERLRDGETGQHDALVTLAVEGAKRWYADPQHALSPTAKVQADTEEWRNGADRILGYWRDHLVAEVTGKILKADMFEDFNRWMTENGHNTWAAETFGPKFANHAETRRHGVEGGKPRNLDGLSRPRRMTAYDMAMPASKRPWVWIGVRFRTDADDAADDLRREPGDDASNGDGQAVSR
jgi:putative DNA primase/helicase